MHRSAAAVAVGMRVIPGKTHALVGVKGSPFAVNFHLQFTAYYHHVFNHPRLVRRGFTQAPGARVMEK